MLSTVETRFRTEFVTICVKLFFNIFYSKTKSDSNMCPISSRGQFLNDSTELRIGLHDSIIFLRKLSFKSFRRMAEKVSKHYICLYNDVLSIFKYLEYFEYNDCIEMITSNCHSLTKIKLDFSLG